MSIPIRSSEEISLIINKGNNAIADIGYDIIGDAKRGAQFSDPDFKDKIYRLILLRTYLKNLVQQDGTLKLYYQSSTNEKKLNYLLDAVNQLSRGFAGSGVPLIRGKRIPLTVSPVNPLALIPAGGIAGQGLKKLSSTDYDTGWGPIITDIEIGPWNMSSFGGSQIIVPIPSYINWKTIRILSITIRNDNDDAHYPIVGGYFSGFAGLYQTGLQQETFVGGIVLFSGHGTFFDSVDFDNVSGYYNRGWITVQYTP